ncbi:MAG: LLM class flavin-dependent oxidoreductase [Methylobacterium sp.]|uniref:LLM class flavin-dependent oxidoreductase n=1 Tax=Methylobacterium sp. TaxID=409 RepID=UPI0027252BDD|nr:LLM class flavin-dependent oxidoreductase [Methylobacterium sp.]MDO9428102.1 LLM class flavin-dependent oxidoreductase [Methylobacterium sp.]
MRLGIWAPAPQTIRPDPTVRPALAALTQHGGGVDESYLYAAETLRRAEDLGFDISLIAQRWLGPDLDSWIYATALATQTRTIELMAAVHPGIMDPRIAAKMAASIDRISGGRFCINIVNGARPQEADMYGEWIETSEARYRRMHEFIRVMKGMWTQDDFNLDGEFYKIEHATVPTKSVRAPHPPIYAASRVDEGMNVVSQECDTWFVNYDKDRRNYAQSLQRIEHEVGLMETRVRSLGRTMNYGINALVLIGDTDEQAEAMADEHVRVVTSDPFITVGTSGVGAALIGTPKTIVERMRRYESLGVGLFMLHFYPMRQGLDEFAEKVLPELRRA